MYSKETMEHAKQAILHQRVHQALKWRVSKVKHGGYIRRLGGRYTDQDVIAQLIKQDVQCAVCRIGLDDNKWHIDHCHINGYVRGLLCVSCNIWLGMWELRIKSAAEYLNAKAQD